jgi:hypothetical protein
MSWKKKLAGVFGSLIAAALIASPARAADMEIGPDRALKMKSDGPTSIAAATSRSGASTVRSDQAREVDIERVWF